MEIELTNTGKRFRLDWIFRHLNYSFSPGQRYAILGPNGSGKSTLLKVLSGHLTPSQGHIQFSEAGKTLDSAEVYQKISYAAPYIELIEELTLREAIQFHAGLKPLLPGFNPHKLYELLQLPRSHNKEIRFFSSGMKQRVKLALAVCSHTPVLLLDEPTTNLDVRAVEWYKNLVSEYAHDRLVVIASNDPIDVDFCNVHLNIMDYKH